MLEFEQVLELFLLGNLDEFSRTGKLAPEYAEMMMKVLPFALSAKIRSVELADCSRPKKCKEMPAKQKV